MSARGTVRFGSSASSAIGAAASQPVSAKTENTTAKKRLCEVVLPGL